MEEFDKHPSDEIFLKLDGYDGALSTLLEIVKKNEINIGELPLLRIVDEYIETVNRMQKLDWDLSWDFLYLMSVLVQLKSSYLLPHTEENYDEIYEAEDTLSDLFMQLLDEQREIFSEKAEKLKALEVLDRQYKGPDFTDANAEIVINGFDFNKLIEAYGQILMKLELEKNQELSVKKIKPDRFTVADKLTTITNELRKKKILKFTELFKEPEITKSEVITTFQALLELMKRQIAAAEQSENGEIEIKVNEEVNIDDFETIQELLLVSGEDEYEKLNTDS